MAKNDGGHSIKISAGRIRGELWTLYADIRPDDSKKADRTVEMLKDRVFLDFALDGELLGIEILGPFEENDPNVQPGGKQMNQIKTICKNCKWYPRLANFMYYDLPICKTPTFCKTCAVSGKPIFVYCRTVNPNGNCPHYKER